MKLIQLDKKHAFSELYSRYRVPLYTYFHGLIGSTLAEELMQDTFIKVLNKRMSFRFESKVKTWIWAIAKNTLRDHWRSVDHKMKNSFDSLVTTEGNEIFEAPLDSAETLILKKVTQRQLEDCINELPVDQKEIVFCHVQSELTNQEIADLSNISVGAVKSILFRSKEKLIDCFKRGGHL
ncbi:MAG: sigma-70 family RNA polymerase sigma factor [Bacteriovorax sp.]|nr:sigma-70 family RNA polymerase sigma factor [Bacteriovorax sp.]